MRAFDVWKRPRANRVPDSCLLERVEPFTNRHENQFTTCPAPNPQLAPSDVRRTFTILNRRSAGSRAGFPVILTGSPGLWSCNCSSELREGCSLEDAAAHLDAKSVRYEEREGSVFPTDPDGRGIQLMPYRPPASEVERRPQHARPSATVHPGGPRRLGHVNCLTRSIREATDFYTDVLGMRISDWLEDGGVWLHVNSDHHVMALVDKGYSHFHHFAFDTVDIGKMRDLLDHLARHGRWLGWGPARHGIAGNIASYVRIVEEECFVELTATWSRSSRVTCRASTRTIALPPIRGARSHLARISGSTPRRSSTSGRASRPSATCFRH